MDVSPVRDEAEVGNSEDGCCRTAKTKVLLMARR